MAAYDAVTSLLHTLDNLSQTHTSHSLLYKESKLKSSDFTNIFHEDINMKHLERMIQEAANGVEDTIDSHQASTSTLLPLDQKDIIVGLDEDLLKIKERLTVQSPRLEVVPIIGMGGIGKTTLARRVYDDSLIAYHFYVRAWANVSQEFDTREIFLGILRSIGKVKDEVERNSTNEQLAEMVYQSLKGRKYLIVLDDMWSIEAWQHVRRSFPDDHNGSRIVLTTRLVDVASCACSGNSFTRCSEHGGKLGSLLIRSLGTKIGRYIGHQCQGLPLAVVSIGGLLSKMRKETSSWENVAEKVGSLMTSDTMDCLNILSLSYNHWPQYLKHCFLYMGVFAETRKIPVWKLIKLWIAGGFIQKVQHKNLEDVTEENLRELVDRSLVLVGKHTFRKNQDL
ncbi:hypothetical protein H5410_000063 [Solanum commersonii]|uniref:NB-ARC domain-containing protein n=1 Tax=Solanum commersonii TaxID=4109 RepID=A0A9J6AVR2_SOLCO|nr:hypothetical protein H5410_000063 [Solanum commersonii]